ncbi:MAG: C13 family peptidase [bacterium]
MNAVGGRMKGICVCFFLCSIMILCALPSDARQGPVLGELGHMRHTYGIYQSMKIEGSHIFCATSLGVVIYNRHKYSVLSFLPLGNCNDLDILTTSEGRSYMYVTMGEEGIYIIDVTTPRAPFFISQCFLPSYALSIILDEHYAYITDRYLGLMVMDITKRQRPVAVGGCVMGECSADNPLCYKKEIALDGDYAYITDGTHGLQVVDMKDRHNPQIIGSFLTPSFASAVMIDANWAYVTDSESGLHIIDIEERAHPRIISSSPTPFVPTSVVADDAYAFVTDVKGGLQVINIADRHHPKIIGSCADIPSSAVDSVVMGDYVYVLDKYYGVQVIDITQKQGPILAENIYEGGYALSVSADDNGYLYIADWDKGLQIIKMEDTPRIVGTWGSKGQSMKVVREGEYVYVAGQGGVKIINSADKEEPALTGEYAVPGTIAALTVRDRYMYAGYDGEFLIIDAEHKNMPKHAGSCSVSGEPTSIFLRDNYAYVTCESTGLDLIYIGDPAAPSPVGHCMTPGRASDVVVDEGYAYVADGEGGLKIISIEEKTSPFIVGGCDTRGEAETIFVEENVIYIADGPRGIKIINCEDKKAPFIEGSCATSSLAKDITIRGNYAYVADYEKGVQVIDLSSQKGPVVAGRYESQGSIEALHMEADYAYLVTEEGGFLVVDCSDTNGLKVIGGCFIPGRGRDMVTNNGYAYVVDRYNGLYIVDIGDKNKPALAGHFSGLSAPESIIVRDDYAYIADGPQGLQIINIKDKASPFKAGTCPLPFYASSLAIKDATYAYCGDPYARFLKVIDIRNPNDPVIAGGYELESSLNSTLEALLIEGDYLYMGKGLEGLEIIDISEGAAPVSISSFQNPLLSNRFTRDIAVEGAYVYCADGYEGVQILDVHERENPLVVYEVDLSPEYADECSVEGEFLYVALREGGLMKFEIISQVSSRGTCILVAGGGADANNTLWPATCTQANHVYNIFTELGFKQYEIYYQNPLLFQDTDNDGSLNQGVVDDPSPTSGELESAIGEWAPDQTYTDGPLYIYLIGHGAEDLFQIMPWEVISAQGLTQSIATFIQKAPEREVVLIIEAAECGSFIDDLKRNDITRNVTTVICATGKGPCYIKPGHPYRSFSTAFVDNVRDHYDPDDILSSLQFSFVSTRAMIEEWRQDYGLFYDQNPQMSLPESSIVSVSFSLDGEIPVDELRVEDESTDLVAIIAHSYTGETIPLDGTDFTLVSSDASVLVPSDEPLIDAYGVYWYKLEFHKPGRACLYAYEEGSDSENLCAAMLCVKVQGLISADDKGAMIVAGYQGSGDYLWPSTNTVANHAYRILHEMGYGKEAIFYYNPFVLQDLDGYNGYDDITGYPQPAVFHMDDDESGFSRIKETGVRELFLFITDHGIEDEFYMNPADTLAARTLAEQISNIAPFVEERITLVYDACYSGSFLDEIEEVLEIDETLANKLVAITSASSDERAYYLTAGVVSFSYAFFDHYFLTNSIMDAFDYAREFLPFTGQTPCILNSSLAAQWDNEDIYYINESRPSIENIEASREAGILSVSAQVYSLNGIDDVWVLVEEEREGKETSQGKAITEAPLKKMERYEGMYRLSVDDPCPERERYFIRVYAQDNHAQVTALPYSIPLDKEGSGPDEAGLNKTVALIFASDTSLMGQDEAQKAATQLYRAESILRAVGVGSDKIMRITSVEGLLDSPLINSLDDESTLLLYFFGAAGREEGGRPYFMIDAYTWVTMDELVHALPAGGNFRVLFLVDTPFATHLLSEVPWDEHEDWAGIASTNQGSIMTPYFSQFFFSSILHGASVAQAYRVAAQAISLNQQTSAVFYKGMEETSGTWQMIDDHLSYYFGRGALSGEELSLFLSCEARRDNDERILFRIEARPDVDIQRAWVILKSLDTSYLPQSMIVDLAPSEGFSYHASYTTSMPYYSAVFMAEGYDEMNLPVFQWEEIVVKQNNDTAEEDPYEPDEGTFSDIHHELRANQPPVKRTFYCPEHEPECTDRDWAYFSAEKGHVYEIYVQDLSEYDYFIRLSLYGPDTRDNEPRISTNYMAFQCEMSGEYYIKIEYASGVPHGAIEYICGLSDPLGGIGIICGYCINTQGQKLSGYTVQVQKPQKSITTDHEGSFCIKNIPFGNYTLTIYNPHDQLVLKQDSVEVVPSFSRREIQFIIDEALPPADYRYRTCTIPFSQGMNISTFPVYPEGVFSPYMLGAHAFIKLYLSPGSALGKYDASSATWSMAHYEEDGHITGDNFPIDPDQGYMLYNAGDSHIICFNIYEPVNRPDAGDPQVIERKGMHVPGYTSSEKTNRELFHSLVGVESIFTFDNNREGRWHAAYEFFGEPAGPEVLVEPYEGYIVFTQEE